MKKLLAFIAPATYFLTPAIAFAEDPVLVDTCLEGTEFSALCNLTAGNFGNIIGTVITLMFVVAVVIALAFLVWGGIKWILSGGDKSAVEAARNTIVAAIVGLVIVFLSYFILSVVLKFFNIDINNLKIPSINISEQSSGDGSSQKQPPGN